LYFIHIYLLFLQFKLSLALQQIVYLAIMMMWSVLVHLLRAVQKVGKMLGFLPLLITVKVTIHVSMILEFPWIFALSNGTTTINIILVQHHVMRLTGVVRAVTPGKCAQVFVMTAMAHVKPAAGINLAVRPMVRGVSAQEDFVRLEQLQGWASSIVLFPTNQPRPCFPASPHPQGHRLLQTATAVLSAEPGLMAGAPAATNALIAVCATEAGIMMSNRPVTAVLPQTGRLKDAVVAALVSGRFVTKPPAAAALLRAAPKRIMSLVIAAATVAPMILVPTAFAAIPIPQDTVVLIRLLSQNLR
jgi:hypothetical protein